MSDTLKKIDKFTRDELKNLLGQCTEKQQAFFYRMYPRGIDDMPETKIKWAIQQCEATILKNKGVKP